MAALRQAAYRAATGAVSLVQYAVRVGQLILTEAVAEFYPFDGIAMAMQIHIKAFAGAGQHVAARDFDETMIFLPRLLGAGVAAGGFPWGPVNV